MHKSITRPTSCVASFLPSWVWFRCCCNDPTVTRTLFKKLASLSIMPYAILLTFLHRHFQFVSSPVLRTSKALVPEDQNRNLLFCKTAGLITITHAHCICSPHPKQKKKWSSSHNNMAGHSIPIVSPLPLCRTACSFMFFLRLRIGLVRTMIWFSPI